MNDAVEARFPGEVCLRDLFNRELHVKTRLEDGSVEEVAVLTSNEIGGWDEAELDTYLGNLGDLLKGLGGAWIELDENKSAEVPLGYGKYFVRVEQGDAVKGETTIILWLNPTGWVNADGTGYLDPFPTSFLRCKRIGDL